MFDMFIESKDSPTRLQYVDGRILSSLLVSLFSSDLLCVIKFSCVMCCIVSLFVGVVFMFMCMFYMSMAVFVVSAHLGLKLGIHHSLL